MALIDLFSLNHALIGFLLAGIFVFSRKKFFFGFSFSASVLFLWEYYEFLFRIGEPLANSLFDLFIGLLFFCLGYIIFSRNIEGLLRYRFTRHEKIVDGWSIVHFFIWATIAVILSFFNIKILTSLIILLPIMILYEYFERLMGVHESLGNALGDIFFDLMGFVLIFLIKDILSVDNKIGLLVNSIVILAFLSLCGKRRNRR